MEVEHEGTDESSSPFFIFGDMVNVSCGITNKVISMKAFIVKSLLTSLYQREGMYPSLAKRGKGRFFSNDVLLFQFLITQAEACGYKNPPLEDIR